MFAQTKSILSFAILATTAVACGGADAAPGASQKPDFTSAFTSEGLALDVSSVERVAGRFERRGAVVRFELRHDGDKRTFALMRDSGEAILESTLERGIDSSSLFGGKATISGPIVGAEPMKRGDDAVFAALGSSREAQLVPELKEALIASHVDRELLSATPAPTANGLETQRWYDGTYWFLGYGETFGFWSWSFWGVTTVVIARASDPSYGYSAAWFRAGAAAPEYVRGWGMQYYGRRWWGAYVTVGNNLLPLSGEDTTMIARAY
ncbi:MAG TPA: hypothetical protein VIF62_27800 [Labilithrix sp.]